MRSPRTALLVVALLLVTLTPAPASSQSAKPRPGSPGIGDPYFPDDGNGGYRVSHYGVQLRWFPGSGRLEGRAVITARTTQALSRFDLDLQLPAQAVTVAGRPARFRSTDHELVVTPAQPLAAGVPVRIVVSYAGRPAYLKVDGGHVWQSLPGGEAFVNGEPHSGAVWLPLNDHPSDKATYDLTVTVPRSWEAVAAGDLVGRRRGAATSSWHWRVADPMPSYQVFLGVGQYAFRRGPGTDLLAYSTSLEPGILRRVRTQYQAQRTFLRWLEHRLGPYPFHHLGMTVLGFDAATIESLGAPVYGHYVFANDYPSYARMSVRHELAHQWFASSVTIRRWQDLWLNEGFATFMTRWYDARHGRRSLARDLRDQYALHPADALWWTVPPGDPGSGPRNLFRTVYGRGSMTLEALHERIGAPAFRHVMRAWSTQHRRGYGSTQQFVALAEKVSGQDLGAFFQEWLFDPDRPAATAANGF
jgi:aminopeptidase N